MDRLTNQSHGGIRSFRIPDEDTMLKMASRLAAYEDAAPLEQVQAWAQAKKEEVCDNCFFKLKSEAWKFNVYPCRECRQRTKSHFTRLGGTFEL